VRFTTFAIQALHIEQCHGSARSRCRRIKRNRLVWPNSAPGESLVDRRIRCGDSQRQVPYPYCPATGLGAVSHEFLPTGTGFVRLCALVRFALRDPLERHSTQLCRQTPLREPRLGSRDFPAYWLDQLAWQRGDRLPAPIPPVTLKQKAIKGN